MQAIRNACKKLGTFDLSGCELYTTGEPCSMCLTACFWANIKKVYYGCTIKDNASIGFRDEKFDKLLGSRLNNPKIQRYQKCIDRDACLELFKEYNEIQNKTMY